MSEGKREAIVRITNQIETADFNQVVPCELKTSERVLKRVTEGIYRQPPSALRELIANAYDADATLVEIQTDPPRFDRIIVRDNGNGLTPSALSSLTQSIGGSPKRTLPGVDMGICAKDDRMRSPGGRKLIGKIGIGLFAVSQLTKEFQIITKTAGTNFRTIADIVLTTYSEDSSVDPDAEFIAGTVKIWKVTAIDTSSHGTEVILRNLLDKTKNDLMSKEMWDSCDPISAKGIADVTSVPIPPPPFHIGRVDMKLPNVISRKPSLPWNSADKPEEKFKKLVQGMYDLRGRKRNPSIEDDLDYYLRMLWILSLSAPLDYIDGHPFDLNSEDGLPVFQISNKRGNQARDFTLQKDQTIRTSLNLISPERGAATEFRVIVDGVQLSRPIKFKNLPKTFESVPYSLLFVGKDAPDLSSYPESIRGGNLEFEGYLLWNHVIVPKEHAGVLIRINDANGVLFDRTFMHYPVSELTRKNQVTAEIFVTKGLDAALNIDRESFNYSHPHYLYLMHWVHNAFRQFSNKHKDISKQNRDFGRAVKAQIDIDEIQQNAEKAVRSIIPDEDILLPIVKFTDDETQAEIEREKGILAFYKPRIFKIDGQSRKRSSQEDLKLEARIKAVATILDAYGIFNEMPYERQQQLLRDIVSIFSQ